MQRKILIATTTRADWGLLAPLARRLAARPDCRVDVMASNMHLDPARGMTIDEIRADGFAPIVAPMPVGFDGAADAARAAGALQQSVADVLERLAPDLTVILGDRFEMLSVAAAAVIMRVPLVHISGGEVTEGAFDDCFRHALTKLSSLHLTATEAYRRRVIQLGERPDRVINTGAIGVMNAAAPAPMSRAELEADLGWSFGSDALLLTVHPETLGPDNVIGPTLEALDRFPDSRVLITYPNNDPAGQRIIDAVNAYAAAQPRGRVLIVPSLGRRRYHSALRCVKAVVGNSSSGIVEVPSAGIATVNIGNRQKGRISAASVINCPAQADAIVAAIGRALASDFTGVENPYSRPDTLDIMERAVAETPLDLLRAPKKFYDINQ